MSIERIVMCDGCGAIATPALESEDPRVLAEKAGWICDEKGDHCPNCHNGEEEPDVNNESPLCGCGEPTCMGQCGCPVKK
jgi:hypothetical protein